MVTKIITLKDKEANQTAYPYTVDGAVKRQSVSGLPTTVKETLDSLENRTSQATANISALETSLANETAARQAVDVTKLNKSDVQDISSVNDAMVSGTNPISSHAMGLMKQYVDDEVSQTIITPESGSIVADNATIKSEEISTNVHQFSVKEDVFPTMVQHEALNDKLIERTAVSEPVMDATYLIGPWHNDYYNATTAPSYQVITVDTGGHNGTIECKLARLTLYRPTLDCTQLIDGKLYRLRFDVAMTSGSPATTYDRPVLIQVSNTKAGSATTLLDVEGREIIATSDGVDAVFQKTNTWKYMDLCCDKYPSSDDDFTPFTMTISNFQIEEVKYHVSNAPDEEPIDKSKNWINSGGVAKVIHKLKNAFGQSGEIRLAIVDEEGNIAAYIDEDTLNIGLDTYIPNTYSQTVTSDELKGAVNAVKLENNISDKLHLAFIDREGNIVLGIDNDGNLISGNPNLDFTVLHKLIAEYITPDRRSDFYKRNMGMESVLVNDCLHGSSSKRLQLAITTDTHLSYASFRKGIEAARDFVSIDAVLLLGDMYIVVSGGGAGRDAYDEYANIFNESTKPVFMTPGNHDIGNNCKTIQQTRDDLLNYERWVKPSVDKGWLKSGEYQEGKCYYYHDFDTYKVRLIMLYPFDSCNPDDEIELSEEQNLSGSIFDRTYWKPVAYEPAAPSISRKAYKAHNPNNNNEPDVVNIPYYTRYSFECVQDVTVIARKSSEGWSIEPADWDRIDYDNTITPVSSTGYHAKDAVINIPNYTACSFQSKRNNARVYKGHSFYNFVGSEYVPCYKALRVPAWYSQDQLEWFCNTLDDAGEKGYICIIAQHYCVMNRLHAQRDATTRFDSGLYASCYNYRYYKEGDADYAEKYNQIIPYIVNAYQNKEIVSISGLKAQSSAPSDRKIMEGDDYISNYTRGYDDTSAIPEINMEYEFSNSGSVLFLHGHNHRDIIYRHKEYNQMQIGFLCNQKGDSKNSGHVNRLNDNDCIAGEQLDVITVYNTGSTMTVQQNGEEKTVPKNAVHITRIGNNLSDKIDENTHSLIKKDNEVIYF